MVVHVPVVVYDGPVHDPTKNQATLKEGIVGYTVKRSCSKICPLGLRRMLVTHAEVNCYCSDVMVS